MQQKTLSLGVFGFALMAVSVINVHAEERYYDPSNVASPTGKTIGYELDLRIGCPGQSFSGTPCKALPPPDSDGDGVIDEKDKCPNTPKGRKVDANGCELDSDGDGVVDGLDKCPNTPKGRKVDANGCELDSDGDGVVDGLDKCPNTPKGRKVDASGCEIDTDGDGLVDGVDKCPTVFAKTADGCPLPPPPPPKKLVLEGVNFDNDKATLRPDAQAILDKAADTLKEWGEVKVEVAGHTDAKASDDYNMKLSQHRAEAVRDYLISKGVAAERLSAKGYGESSPIADNESEEGRAKNRRVELVPQQ